ncbi:MAG TPA: carboxypeptidase-like regulatory domain-containing protein [Candidatus Binataceae bacterium]|jgi:hypothetical protein|nr:carboxypeptidase-like regulatory domain-containing protein [Candidatus Binataceae bacterium]
MNKLFVVLTAGCALLAAAISPAPCAEIVGTVLDANGNAVPGVRVSTTTQDGQRIGDAVSDGQGAYAIDDVSSGLYYITLAPPAGSDLHGQSVASYVGGTGLTVNWAVAPGREPVAAAMPGVNNDNPGISAIAAASKPHHPPHGCKGMPGPPCGPKKSKKRGND